MAEGNVSEPRGTEYFPRSSQISSTNGGIDLIFNQKDASVDLSLSIRGSGDRIFQADPGERPHRNIVSVYAAIDWSLFSMPIARRPLFCIKRKETERTAASPYFRAIPRFPASSFEHAEPRSVTRVSLHAANYHTEIGLFSLP